MHSPDHLHWNEKLKQAAFGLILFSFLVLEGSAQLGLPPDISVHPSNQTVLKGGTVSFAVVASSLTSMSYKWYRDGSLVSGATASTYTITNAQPAQAGVYRVDVINVVGTTTSSNATLTVLLTNDVPVANQDAYTTAEEVSLTIPARGILANDTDAYGSPLIGLLVNDVSNGSLNLNTNGGFTYVPDTNFSGTDSFTYRAWDGQVTTLQENTSGGLKMEIKLGQKGAQSFRHGAAGGASYTIRKVVLYLSREPTAPNTNLNFSIGSGLYSGPLPGSSVAINPATILNTSSGTNFQRYEILYTTPVGPLTAGTTYYLNLECEASNTKRIFTDHTGSSTYTNGTYYKGAGIDPGDLKFQLAEGPASADATVTITVTPVNDAPIAFSQSVTNAEDTALPITLTSSDVDGPVTNFTFVSLPSYGTLSGSAPNLVYQPAANYNGPDSFTFYVDDGALSSAIATVSITVTPVVDAPVARDDAYTTPEDVVLNIPAPGVLANDTSVDGKGLTAWLVSGVTNGALSLNLDGSFTYTPNLNYNGSDGFTYQASDAVLELSTGTGFGQQIALGKKGAQSFKHGTAGDPSYTIQRVVIPLSRDATAPSTNPTFNIGTAVNSNAIAGSSRSIAPASITDTSGGWTFQPLEIVYDPPLGPFTAGTTYYLNLDCEAANTAKIYVDSAGNNFGAYANGTYLKQGGATGDDMRFSLFTDGTNSTTATVMITVTPVNDAPVAYNQSVTIPEDTAAYVTLRATDVDSTNLVYAILASPAKGTLTVLDSFTGAVTYQPATNYYGADSFTFTAFDGSLYATGQVILSIMAVNDAPVANAQSVSTPANVAMLISLTGSDVENSPLTFSIITPPGNGALSGLNLTNGTVTYTPVNNYWGTDSFTFQVNDGASNSTPATVSMTVTPVANIATTQTGPASIAPLKTFAYTVTVTNSGPTAATGVVVSDNLSPSLTFVGASGGGTYAGGVVTWPALSILAVGATTNFTVTVKSPIQGTLTNTVSSTADSSDPNASNNNGSAAGAQAVTTVSPLQIDNTSSAGSVSNLNWNHTVSSGSSRILVVGVSIDNPATLVTSATFNNSLPLTLIGQTNGTQTKVLMYYLLNPPIGTYPISITLNAASGVVGGAASFKGVQQGNPIAGFAGNKGSNSSASVTLASAVGGTVISTVAPKSPAAAVSPGAGQNAEWNRSTNNFSGAGSSAPGATSVTPTWSLSGSASWAMAAVALNYSRTIADIAVAATGPTNVVATSNLTYFVTVTNLGPNSATNLVVSDTLPAGAIFVSASDGGTATNGVVTWPALTNFISGAITNYTVTIQAPTLGTLTNFVASSANTADPDPSNNNGTAANAQVITAITPLAELAVFLTGPATSVLPGTNYSYTITVTNAGPSAALNLSVTYQLPTNVSFVSATGGGVVNGSQILWTNLGSLASGAVTSVTLTVTAPLRGTVTNLASAGSAALDLNPANNLTPPLTTTVSNLPPVANNDSYTTPEDTALTVPAAGVLANDTDANADTLTAILVAAPAHGALTLSPNGGFTYTPVTNYNGPDAFTYQASDGVNSSTVATVSLTITPVSDVPIAFSRSLTNAEDAALPITLTSYDPDGPVTNFTLLTQPLHGTLSGTAPNLMYQPATNYNGADSFTFSVNDGSLTSAVATVSLTITAVNDPPVLSGANDLTSINMNDVTSPGTLVSALLAGRVTDWDSGALSGLAVIGADNTHGAWQYTTNGGGVWMNFGSPTALSARLLAADANTRVRFVPNTNWGGKVTGGLNFFAWDQTSGTAGGTASLGTISTLLDQFSAVSYSNNDGTANWSGDWVENDKDSGGASAGLFKVSGGRLDLTADRTDDWIYRPANLSGAGSATLSLDYSNALGFADSYVIQISSDGGASYSDLPGGGFSSSLNTRSGTLNFDITPFISANTKVQIYETSDSSASHLYLDNIQILSITSVASAAFSANSASAKIIVIEPPAIATPPQSRTKVAGQTATFTVSATGTGPLSYQWKYNGSVLSGATGSTLTLNSVQPTNAGDYTVVVTNSAGSVTSAVATLTVLVPPTAATLSASGVTAGSAMLNATVNPQGTATSCYFEFGFTTNYGSFSATNTLPSGTNSLAGATSIAGLASGTLHHYRVVAINAAGTTTGQDMTFTTTPVAPPQLRAALTSPGGNMRFTLSAAPGASFTLLSTTNLSLSMSNWTAIGTMAETSPGLYEFVEAQPPTEQQRYYGLRSP